MLVRCYCDFGCRLPGVVMILTGTLEQIMALGVVAFVFNYIPAYTARAALQKISRRTIAAPSLSDFKRANASAPDMYFMPQSGEGIRRSGGR